MDVRHIGFGWMSSYEPRAQLGWPARIALFVAIGGMLAAVLVAAASPLILARLEAPAASATPASVRTAADRKRLFDERRDRFEGKGNPMTTTTPATPTT